MALAVVQIAVAFVNMWTVRLILLDRVSLRRGGLLLVLLGKFEDLGIVLHFEGVQQILLSRLVLLAVFVADLSFVRSERVDS